MRIILLGAPGSGKGTQSELLVSKFNILHLSTGDLLRAEVAAKTALGQEAKTIMDAGQLVPDAIVLGMIQSQLCNAKNGFLLDGYPRNINQAQQLDQLLTQLEQPIEHVIYFDVPFELIKTRLLSRGRSDDNEAIINKRRQVFEQETFPLIDYYQKQHKLTTILGVGDIQDIHERIVNALKQS